MGLARSDRAFCVCRFMVENLPCDFHAFHYLRRNRIAYRAGSSCKTQEMTMSTLSRSSPSASGKFAWLLNLVTWLLARSLNMPEPLVHNTGVFLFVHVQAVENSVGRTLCPIRLLRRFRSWLR